MAAVFTVGQFSILCLWSLLTSQSSLQFDELKALSSAYHCISWVLFMDFLGNGYCGTHWCGKVHVLSHTPVLWAVRFVVASEEGVGDNYCWGEEVLSTSIVSSTLDSLGFSSHFQLWPFSIPFPWQQEPGPSLAPLCGWGSKSIPGEPRIHVPPLLAQPGTVFCPLDIAEKSSPKLVVILLMYLCFPSSRPRR